MHWPALRRRVFEGATCGGAAPRLQPDKLSKALLGAARLTFVGETRRRIARRIKVARHRVRPLPQRQLGGEPRGSGRGLDAKAALACKPEERRVRRIGPVNRQSVGREAA